MDTRSLRTKNALADALRELMLDHKFEKISVEQICVRAGLTRRNFYRHFLDKHDLLGYIYNQDFDIDFSEHPDWTIYEYLPIFCERLYANRDFYRKAYTIPGQNNIREHCFKWAYPLLHRHAAKWFSDPEMEMRLLRISSYATFDAFVDWLSHEPCLPPEQFMAKYYIAMKSYSKYTENLAKHIPDY